MPNAGDLPRRTQEAVRTDPTFAVAWPPDRWPLNPGGTCFAALDLLALPPGTRRERPCRVLSLALASTWVKADRLHPLIPRETVRSRKLYRSRGAGEREFGRLKHEWALLPLRVRGLDRVRLHADLTILVKFACHLRASECCRSRCRQVGG